MLRKQRFTTIAAMLALPLAVLSLIAKNVERTVSAQGGRGFVEAPENWVPFSADITITTPKNPSVVGRFYRAADGSRRTETGPALDDIRVIHIVNVSEATTYTFSRREWVRRPGPGIDESGRPALWLKNLPNWTVHPYKLAVRKGESGSIAAREGFSAYRVVTAQGVLHLKVPELNLFDVVNQRPDGRYEAYTNIEVGDPPSELFWPPLGDTVLDKPTPPSTESQVSQPHH